MIYIVCVLYMAIFPFSSVVEQLAVNQLVVGSNPTGGAKIVYFKISILNRFFTQHNNIL